MIKELWEKAQKTGKAQKFGPDEKKEFVEEFHNYSSSAMARIKENRLKSEKVKKCTATM